ncbi:MAG: hypothetical protein KDC71_20375 [Acidobacteria bacterium]|nr:hypothetical protein [Acidobacteriota bacterium]MCB9236258.1 hypothetical protein [Bacteroidia bacterium]
MEKKDDKKNLRPNIHHEDLELFWNNPNPFIEGSFDTEVLSALGGAFQNPKPLSDKLESEFRDGSTYRALQAFVWFSETGNKIPEWVSLYLLDGFKVYLKNGGTESLDECLGLKKLYGAWGSKDIECVRNIRLLKGVCFFNYFGLPIDLACEIICVTQNAGVDPLTIQKIYYVQKDLRARIKNHFTEKYSTWNEEDVEEILQLLPEEFKVRVFRKGRKLKVKKP